MKPQSARKAVAAESSGWEDLPLLLVVRAVGISKTRLHNWLIRQSVHLDAHDKRSEEKHRRYSRLDLVRLGFVAQLTAFGIPARQASECFEDLLKGRYDMRSRTRRDSEAKLLEFLRGSTMAINALHTGSEGCFGWPEVILITDGLRFGKQKKNPRIPAECDTTIVDGHRRHDEKAGPAAQGSNQRPEKQKKTTAA